MAEIAHTQVWSDGRPVEVRRLAEGLEAPVAPGLSRVVSAYADRGVIDYQGDSFIITLAAYVQSKPISTESTLPLGLNDDQLRLLWVERSDGTATLRATRLGKPVADAVVKVFRGTAESTEIRIDKNGEVAVPDRTRGGVSCLAQVETPTPGRRDGKAYSFIRYKATLTLHPPATPTAR